MKIILASGSLGRRKLLESFRLKFEVMEPSVDEEKIVDADPVKMAVARAKAKAEWVAHEFTNLRIKELTNNNNDGVLIIGADTVGWLGKWVFNKPKSRKEAEDMLARLSGKTHKYVSAHCVVKIEGKNNRTIELGTIGKEKINIKKTSLQFYSSKFHSSFTDYDISSVTFRKLTRADISFYLDRVEYLKLCGAFKIMGSPQNFVTKTGGSISNIIGLSLEKLIPVFVKNC